jgi:hypothetical protein
MLDFGTPARAPAPGPEAGDPSSPPGRAVPQQPLMPTALFSVLKENNQRGLESVLKEMCPGSVLRTGAKRVLAGAMAGGKGEGASAAAFAHAVDHFRSVLVLVSCVLCALVDPHARARYRMPACTGLTRRSSYPCPLLMCPPRLAAAPAAPSCSLFDKVGRARSGQRASRPAAAAPPLPIAPAASTLTTALPKTTPTARTSSARPPMQCTALESERDNLRTELHQLRHQNKQLADRLAEAEAFRAQHQQSTGESEPRPCVRLGGVCVCGGGGAAGGKRGRGAWPRDSSARNTSAPCVWRRLGWGEGA